MNYLSTSPRYQCTVGNCRRLFTRRSYLIKHLNREHIGQLEENHAIRNIDYSKLHTNTSDSLYNINRTNNKSLMIPLHQTNLDK
uniref:C2H2-type domain-containing protein n=1 Tax=Ditylenchus dipsaci TaxID=166011 RepID=A0A915DU34_9BILA